MLASRLDLREVQRNQSLAELAEKEMGYILSDLSNIATQAALVAGFVYSSVADPSNDRPETADDSYAEQLGDCALVTAATIMINLIAITNATFVMTSGPYQALTGDEETLWRTLRTLQRERPARGERQRVINWYWAGVASLILSLIFSVYFGPWRDIATYSTIVVAAVGVWVILRNRRRIAAGLSPQASSSGDTGGTTVVLSVR